MEKQKILSPFPKQSNFFNVDFFSDCATESSSKSSSDSLNKPFIGEMDIHIFLIKCKNPPGEHDLSIPPQ